MEKDFPIFYFIKMLLEDDQLQIVLSMIVIIILIIYLIGHVFRSTAIDYPLDCVYIKPNDLYNGDIVCVAYYNLSGAIVSSFSNSIWSHTGIIYVDPKTDIRYVLEGAVYRHEKYKHFFKIPLETWLHFNRKNLIGYKKYYGPEISSDFLWKKFEWMVKDCKLEPFNIFWSRFLCSRAYYEYSRRNKYTCLEATVILAQDIGIFEKDKIYSSYFPGNVVNNQINLCNGISYDPPIKISLHPTNSMLLQEDIISHPRSWKN